MKVPFLSLFLFFLFTACSSVETIEVKDDSGILTERFTQNKKTKQKEGKLTRFFEDGAILEESNYQKDTLHGERKLFYEDGQLQSLEKYKKGSFDGLYQAFYNNGQVELEGNYTNGAMNGLWTRFYETGEKMEVVSFKNNEENGPFTEYHINGQLKAKGAYIGGDREHGELQLFNETGQLIKKMNCIAGRCKTTWVKEAVEGEKSI